MLIRSDQVRGVLALIHEARKMVPGAAQKQCLVAGFHRLVGAAMTSFGVIRDFGRGQGFKVEQEVCAPADGAVRAMIDVLRTGSSVSPGLQAMARLLRRSSMVTACRRELLSDEVWYRSGSFNEYHRPCGFDDYVYSFRVIAGGRISGVAIRRGLDERPFGDEEKNLLEVFHEEIVRLETAQRHDHRGPRLAPREQEVLQRLLLGASEKEVAYDLNLSQHTVHSYAKSIYSAYGVSSRAELLVRCLAPGAAKPWTR